jgi:hypothetical protein
MRSKADLQKTIPGWQSLIPCLSRPAWTQVVNRDNLFLLGTPDDGGPDGITAPNLPNPWIDVWPQLQYAIEAGLTDNVALLIRDSRYVYIGQELTFELGLNEGGWGTVRVVDSLVAFEDCDILNSRGIGMVVEDSAVLAGGLDLTGCKWTYLETR